MFCEAGRQLYRSNPFTRKGIAEIASGILGDQYLTQHFGKASSLLARALDINLSPSHRLGIGSNALKFNESLGGKPLKVRLIPGPVASLAIFVFLREQWGCQIDLDYHHVYTSEMTSAMRNGFSETVFGACVLPVAAATDYLGGQTYKSAQFIPLMVMPKTSHRIVRPNDRKVLAGGLPKSKLSNFHLIDFAATTSSLFFEKLLKEGYLSKGKVKTTSAEYPDIIEMLSIGEGNDAGILWFPYYWFAREFLDAVVDEEPSGLGDIDLVLFVNKDTPVTTQILLELAVRSAWITLRDDPELLRIVIDQILGRRDYVDLLFRISGMKPHQSR
jgi:hypothetical protein